MRRKATKLIAGGILVLSLGLSAPVRAQTEGERTTSDIGMRITGTLPATLADFKIDPPSLFAIPVKNEMPVRVEMTWHREN